MQFGNQEVTVKQIVTLTTIAGPIGEQDTDPDAIFLRFERETYTRAEVIELVKVIAEVRPDECDVDGPDLRLWWD